MRDALPAIAVRDLRVARHLWSLEIPRLDIPRGHVVGLVGPNGSGKTTLLRLLPGLDQPHRGHVEVLGRDPEVDPAGVRLRLGWMSDAMPLPDMAVPGLAAMWARLYPTWDVGLAADLLHRFRVETTWRPWGLSRGEAARLRLWLTLAWRPEVVVLDEPAAGLDLATRRTLLAEVTEVARGQDRTVVVSSHHLDDIARVATWLVVLSRGRVRAEGPYAELVPPGTDLEAQLAAWGAAG